MQNLISFYIFRLVQSSVIRTEYKTTSYNLTTHSTDSTVNNNSEHFKTGTQLSNDPPLLAAVKTADSSRDHICTEQLIKQETVETRTETSFERSVSIESTVSSSTDSAVETSYITSTTWNPRRPQQSPPSSPIQSPSPDSTRKHSSADQHRKFSAVNNHQQAKAEGVIAATSGADGRTRVFITPDREAASTDANRFDSQKPVPTTQKPVSATNKNIRALINRINRRSFVESELTGSSPVLNELEQSSQLDQLSQLQRSVSPEEGSGSGLVFGGRTSTTMKTEFKEKIDSSWEEVRNSFLPTFDLFFFR
jgi:hypothetical protein